MLIQALRSRAPRIRHYATRVLGDLPAAGRLAVSELIETLDDEDELVSMGALSALGTLGPTATPAVSALIAVLQGAGTDGDDLVIQGMAADALGTIGPNAHEAVFSLLQCLKEAECDPASRYFRLQVAWAVWKIQHEPEYLLAAGIEALADSDWRLRQVAATLLGEFGPAGYAAIPHLQQAMADEHPLVRQQAAAALEQINAR